MLLLTLTISGVSFLSKWSRNSGRYFFPDSTDPVLCPKINT